MIGARMVYRRGHGRGMCYYHTRYDKGKVELRATGNYPGETKPGVKCFEVGALLYDYGTPMTRAAYHISRFKGAELTATAHGCEVCENHAHRTQLKCCCCYSVSNFEFCCCRLVLHCTGSTVQYLFLLRHPASWHCSGNGRL
jgi:hypothetical protein